MSARAAVITGARGGIGSAIARRLVEGGYFIIGIDAVAGSDEEGIAHLCLDLASLTQPEAIQLLGRQVRSTLADTGGAALSVLVNNAAWQGIGPAESSADEVITRSLAVIVTAPMLLSRLFYPELAANRGCIVNIGSIHARLTKPGFSAYSTSKAALAGLTRALAVEWGAQVRVNAIEPAAIATPMLEAGFAGDPEGRALLAQAHPSRQVGDPELVARWVAHLVDDPSPFCNGMIINLDGGISHRLHDPGH